MKFKFYFSVFSILLSFSSFAFMIECKSDGNPAIEARFIQQNANLPLLGQINNGMIYHLNMSGSEVLKNNTKVYSIKWENEEKDIFLYLNISNDVTSDQSLGRPWVYKSRLYLGGANSTAIDNVVMACRTFFIN